MSRAALSAVALGALALLVAPGPAAAQSLLGASGLGFPIDPLDARARALGGVAVGLFGPAVHPAEPAAAADLALPSATLTLAGSWVDVHEEGATRDATGTRFPVIGVSYPVRGWGVATLTFGSVMDQRWQVSRDHTLPVGDTVAEVRDVFLSDGGIGALRLGFARRIAPSLAVGASVGTYTGDLTRRFTRTFQPIDPGTDPSESQIGGFWRYSGLTGSVGAMVDVAEVARFSASLGWSGDLKAEPSDDTPGAAGRFDVPLELRAGASGRLTPGLVANVGLSYADWSAAGEVIQDESGGTALTVGGGVEWTEASLFGRRAPFRIGYRRSSLPFTFGGEDAVETALTAGVGIDLVVNQNVTLAGMGISLERGSREAGTLSEDFLRASLTLRVSGF